jgi:hypothetical protein
LGLFVLAVLTVPAGGEVTLGRSDDATAILKLREAMAD